MVLSPFVGWCACFPEGLASLCLPFYPWKAWHLATSIVTSPFWGLVSLASCLVSACLPSCLHLLCVLLPEALFSLSPAVPYWMSSYLFPLVGWCVHLPPCLALSVSLLVVFVGWRSFCFVPWLCLLCFPACRPACLSFCFPLWRVVSFCTLSMLWKYWIHTSTLKLLARLEAFGSGIENDIIFHFHPPMYSLHPIWHSSADWFGCLDPDTCAPIGCFLHRFAPSSIAT